MTTAELKRKFPNASHAFLQQNADDNDGGVCAVQPKPIKRMPLDITEAGEEACWHDANERFEIVFTVYSVRPCDWDGYDIKSLQDFLVSAGVIPGDGWKTLSGRVVSRKAATKEEEKTVIAITTQKERECRILEITKAPTANSSEPEIIENGICDGCGKQAQYLQVVNCAPVANACICRACLETNL